MTPGQYTHEVACVISRALGRRTYIPAVPDFKTAAREHVKARVAQAVRKGLREPPKAWQDAAAVHLASTAECALFWFNTSPRHPEFT